MEEAERRTRERYLAIPDDEPEVFDAEAWGEPPAARVDGKPAKGRRRG